MTINLKILQFRIHFVFRDIFLTDNILLTQFLRGLLYIQVSISSTFYVQIFHTNFVLAAFSTYM